MSRIHLPTAPVTLNPGFEFYPSIGRAGADASLIVVNFDVQYQLEAESVEPYVGAVSSGDAPRPTSLLEGYRSVCRTPTWGST